MVRGSSVNFREATAADRDRILALREECFGDVDAEKRDPRFWNWEFGRARIFTGELEDGTAATHLALVDLPYMLDGSEVPGALAVDAMTAPGARGQGAFGGVVRHAMTTAQPAIATAYQIRKPVLGAMLRAGWTAAERVPVLVRPAWTLRRVSEEAVLSEDDAGWMSELGPRDGCVARTPGFLAWRFFANPHWRYRVTGVPGQAYCVTRRTTLKGFDTLAIVDLAWRNSCHSERSEGPVRAGGTAPAQGHAPLSVADDRHAVDDDLEVARNLLRNAIARGRSERCTLVAALVSPRHPAFGMFLRAGFLPGPHWFRLLVYPPEHASRPWRVMWADTDHL
jgi:hypothetical protein